MPLPRATIRSVRDFARRHDLLRPGPLVVAASGGADSTALVLILGALAEELGLVLHVAHFDHRMRARAAAADAAFVSDLAARVGAPIRVGRATAAPKNEDEARAARYAFLRRTATAVGARAIATGHTRDDQAETVLLHATRGSGLAGLAAMRPSREGIVRPLLCVGRADTLAVCAAAGITPREDPTNRDERYARNRIRRSVLPELARINPRAAEALARLSDVASEALTSLQARAATLLDEARVGDQIELAILDREPTLRSEALALAWTRATGRVLSARGRDALARLAMTHAGTASIDLAGGRAEREYARLRLVTRAGEVLRVPGVATPSLSGATALVARPPRDRAAVAPLEGTRGSGRSKGEGVEPERVASTQRRARKGRPG